MTEKDFLTAAQLGIGDMEPAEFRSAGHRVVDLVADYLAGLETYRVLPTIEPGAVKAQLPASPPAQPEPLDQVLGDFTRLIQPNITHWQHPGFMAYFASTASGPGILGEWLSAALNSNVMFWRVAPASTELEETVVSWMRQMLGLPDTFDGMFTDTASMSTLLSIVAARHRVPGLDARERGLAGRPEAPRLMLYCSEEAHSSTEKGAIVAGIGREGVRRIGTDDRLRLRIDLLEQAIAADKARGLRPFCIVGMAGTTSTNAVDPLPEIAALARREGLWLHIDAAYAGTAALVPEMRPLLAGWEQADSIVTNPHKWMFTPFDASLLLFRQPEVYRDAFSLTPEYLKVKDTGPVHNFHDYGIQLGRRFRALKLWLMIRYFGAEGMANRIREHLRLTRLFLSWLDHDPDWQQLAPAPFSTVCLRHRPAALAPRENEPEVAAELDRRNQAILEKVNASGEIFLSHTKIHGRFTIRVTLGNLRQEERHIERCWALLKAAAVSCP